MEQLLQARLDVEELRVVFLLKSPFPTPLLHGNLKLDSEIVRPAAANQ